MSGGPWALEPAGNRSIRPNTRALGGNFFVMSPSLDRVPERNPGFNRALGHPLELIPETNPVTPMGPGLPIRVRLLYKGKGYEFTKYSAALTVYVPQVCPCCGE